MYSKAVDIRNWLNQSADIISYDNVFQGAFKIYELPADPNAEMPLRFFEKLPSADAVVSVV